MPFPFYITCLVILVLGAMAWEARWKGWGIPMGMVLATVGAWYVGDALYNDYKDYRLTFGDATLSEAWWQVVWFLITFAGLVPLFHGWMNGRIAGRKSHVMAYLEHERLRHPEVQRRIDAVAKGLFAAWFALMLIALIQVQGDFIGLFAPYLGGRADPWARGQIGGGFSAFISLAAYLQVFLTAACGVMAALSLNPRTRNMALMVCVLALPYYIFDRTRNTMLATVLPGLLALVFMRLRVSWLAKFGCLALAFLVVNFWFTFVMANRTGSAISTAFASGGNQEAMEDTRHEGLNMFEELAWIRHFTKIGVYMPNGGQRYLAELANPIPRAIWKNKPTIGLDYAVARGQAAIGPSGEVTATISTGMIGQGVVNFGSICGPLAAAALMALWVAILARQDLQGANPGRIILYGSGLILTFNLGRDITLLVMYPFFFGLGLFWIWERSGGGRLGQVRKHRAAGGRGAGSPRALKQRGRMAPRNPSS